MPKWLDVAKGEIGVKEVTGIVANHQIVDFLACTSLPVEMVNSDETPWCSAFINWCMGQAGIQGTGLANARSWLDWGDPLDKPVEGCVVVLRRGAPPSGHVTFFVREFGDSIVCLGGNQGNQVKYSTYQTEDVIGYRWPKGEPV